MRPAIRLPVILTALLLMAIGVVVVLVIQRSAPRTISQETSPDGSWLVRVEASPQLLGGYEVVVRVGNAQGVIEQGGFVIGLLDNLDSAEITYRVTFDDNETARIGDRVIEKSKYFQ
ncbi:MAG: hypothetical protein ACR2NP_02055 [Pirellulaceae bacterium]